jgi:hypothetical protein
MKNSLLAGAGLMASHGFSPLTAGSISAGKPDTLKPPGIRSHCFRIADGKHGKTLIDPDGLPFFSIAFNHIDPAPLMQLQSLPIWRENYGNDMDQWLSRVRSDLVSWGFNSVGWVQDVVVRGKTMRRHSRNFTYEEYQWLDMPYFHMLPFADFHQWEVETRLPDFFSREFEEWCDYVAKTHCARMAEDSKLVGYFYVDCPTWIHVEFENPVKGAIVSPTDYATGKGKLRLKEVAEQYYRVTHEAVRRYDPDHLIFGDRYEANRPVASEVIQAALPFVDVLSFQHFNTPQDIVKNLRHWHHQTGKPVLMADFGHHAENPESEFHKHHTGKYRETLELLREEPSCVGSHLCGAYLANRSRKRGILDEREQYTYPDFDQIVKANHDTLAWFDANG